eukprot:11543554-Alexandrium_andersonii.AAC.1
MTGAIDKSGRLFYTARRTVASMEKNTATVSLSIVLKTHTELAVIASECTADGIQSTPAETLTAERWWVQPAALA